MQMVSTIIPNWNGKELLRDCLPALGRALANYPEATEIIVVDNGSTDGSVDYLHSEFPEVGVIEFDENRGFAAACNEGAHRASHELLLFLNNDVVVSPDFLTALLPHFRELPNLFAVTSRLVYQDTGQLNLGRTCAKFHHGYFEIVYFPDVFDAPRNTLFASGASSLVNRSKFLQLGGFQPDFLYFEDVDVSYRAWKRGWPVLYEPRSIVYHKGLGTSSKLFTLREIEEKTTRNCFLFMWKNITDLRLIAAHLVKLPLFLSIAALRRNWHVWRALGQAIQNRSEALVLRRIEMKESRVSDNEVLSFCRGDKDAKRND